MSCKEFSQKIISNLHYLNVYSDIFYLIAGIYSYILSKQVSDDKKKFFFSMSIVYIVMGIISIYHHSYPKRNWIKKLDITTASIGTILSLVFLIYNYRIGRINKILFSFLFILSIFAIIMFLYSQYVVEIKLGGYDSADSNEGPIGPILRGVAETDEERDYYQIMRYVFHTIWHVLTGIIACITVFSLV